MNDNNNIRFNLLALLCLVCLFSLAGCAHTQYEKVAKEWCTAMRANQMIPVYPLNQDIQPGDVYLVRNTIGSQAEEYKKKGFLTLDDLRTRLKLKPETYNVMYFDSYFKSEGSEGSEGKGQEKKPPPFSYPNIPSATEENTSDNKSRLPTTLTPTPAPRVAFPSYSFTIKRGVGLSLGVPISSIPVALNFLGAQETSAIVTLANASTYQADHETIMEKLRSWVSDPQVKAALIGACQHVGKEYVYLRVVKRVYLVGAVDVALERKDKYQWDLQAGLAEQAVDPQISYEKFEENIKKQAKLLDQLNKMAAQNKIGGAINVNIATQHNIGLRESFDRPLVVGYLGVDVPFFKDGRLGAPVPTFEHLELPDQYRDPKPIELAKLSNIQQLFQLAMCCPDTRQKALTAAQEFCQKIGRGDDKFVQLGKKAKGMNDRLTASGSISSEEIESFIKGIDDEITQRSTVGPNKAEDRIKLEMELRSALRKQGIYSAYCDVSCEAN